MKKSLAFVLALMLALCVSVTSLAEGDNTTTVTATVEHAPTWTFHIPSDTAITQNTTDPVQLGGESDSVYVYNLTNMENKKLTCTVTAENLKSGTNEIETSYTYQTAGMEAAAELAKFDCDVNPNAAAPYIGTKIFAQVAQSAWDGAPNGEYSATLTFTFAAEDADFAAEDAEPVPPALPEWEVTFSDTEIECEASSLPRTFSFNPATVSGGSPEIRYDLVNGEGALPGLDSENHTITISAGLAAGEYVYVIKASINGGEAHADTQKCAEVRVTVTAQ